MRINIPPVSSFRVFEAAAKHGSFGRAAEELGVTAGAVSQHIRILESYAGATLFKRGGRGVSLTEAGQLTLDHVTPALDAIVAAGEAMRSFRKATRAEPPAKTEVSA